MVTRGWELGYLLQCSGVTLIRLDRPIFMAITKLLLIKFGIHHRLESYSLIVIYF